MVPGMAVFGVRSLPQVVALLTGADEIPEAPPVAAAERPAAAELARRGAAR